MLLPVGPPCLYHIVRRVIEGGGGERCRSAATFVGREHQVLAAGAGLATGFPTIAEHPIMKFRQTYRTGRGPAAAVFALALGVACVGVPGPAAAQLNGSYGAD